MLVTIIETIATSKSQRTYEQKLARALKLLRKQRREGNPDRLREEDVLRIMENRKGRTEAFWAKGGYEWDGSNC
jgi:hypothetical protein